MDFLNVYVTNLAAYNEGFLIGEWVKLPTALEELEEVLFRIQRTGADEEYFMTDWEGIFASKVSEYSDIFKLNEEVQELQAIIENFDFQDSFIEYVYENTCDISDFENQLESVYVYHNYSMFASDSEVVGELLVEYGFFECPEYIQSYLDYEKIGNDWLCSGYHLYRGEFESMGNFSGYEACYLFGGC